jgi:hypothetical protein
MLHSVHHLHRARLRVCQRHSVGRREWGKFAVFVVPAVGLDDEVGSVEAFCMLVDPTSHADEANNLCMSHMAAYPTHID